jgi:hypothetical protein
VIQKPREEETLAPWGAVAQNKKGLPKFLYYFLLIQAIPEPELVTAMEAQCIHLTLKWNTFYCIGTLCSELRYNDIRDSKVGIDE